MLARWRESVRAPSLSCCRHVIMTVTVEPRQTRTSHEDPTAAEKTAVPGSGSGSDSTTEERGLAETKEEEARVDLTGLPPSSLPPLPILPDTARADAAAAAADLRRPSTAGGSHSGSTATAEGGETYPEGGARAWSVVLGCWLALVASLGLANSLGTFQAYLVVHQLVDVDEGSVGWIFSLYTFVLFFLGLYIGPFFDKYGPRLIVLVGTVLTCAGLMLFSISTGGCLPLLLSVLLMLVRVGWVIWR